MKKNNRIVQIFLMIALLLCHLSLSAMDSTTEQKPDFVLAVFATHRARASMLEKAAAQNILAYNINWESTIDIPNNCVRNVWTRSGNKWVRVDQAPLPNAVYDFGVYKKAQNKKTAARLLKKQLRDHNIPFINPDEDMASVNDKLLFSTIMNEHHIPHPETFDYSQKQLNKMLTEHDILFIKPKLGSKGQGIIIVEKNSSTGAPTFSVSFKIKKRQKWVPVRIEGIAQKKVYQAVADAKKKLKTSKGRYLIQQGINAYRFDNHQTDFRINVQRSDDRTVQATGMFMRVGGNMSQGGRAADYRVVLKSLAEQHGIPVEDIGGKIADIAIACHLGIEQFVGKNIGELGIDAVVDNKGNVFIIEANNKSGYVSTYLKKNPLVDTLYGLPEHFEECKRIDNAHEDFLIEYARHLVDITRTR